MEAIKGTPYFEQLKEDLGKVFTNVRFLANDNGTWIFDVEYQDSNKRIGISDWEGEEE